MSTKYTSPKDVPNSELSQRLKQLSDACISRLRGDSYIFDREFTCRIPVEVDRDADIVLAEAARRILIND